MLLLFYTTILQGGAGVTGALTDGSATKVPTAHQEQFGVQYLAQGYFGT